MRDFLSGAGVTILVSVVYLLGHYKGRREATHD